MPIWKEETYKDENEAFAAEFVGDGDSVAGFVVRYFDDAPTYAWARGARLGAFSNDVAAKAAVEAAVKNGDRT